MARFESGQASENNDRIADADEIFESRGVPVRETNATVTGGAADRLRIIRAVDPDAGFVQAHPNYTDEIVRAGRKIVIILRAANFGFGAIFCSVIFSISNGSTFGTFRVSPGSRCSQSIPGFNF